MELASSLGYSEAAHSSSAKPRDDLHCLNSIATWPTR